MKNYKTTALLTLTALLLGAPVQAQQISTSLPLTSVGSHLLWEVGDQTLTLNVPVSGQVKLDLYSPRLDQSDYRSADYYGDEQYDGNASAVTTTFVLVDGAGREVLRRAFAPGAHAWETLIDQTLPAGQYRLRAVTQGNGKNTFAIRLTGSSAAVTADHLTVNVQARAWMPVVNVAVDGAGYTLRMYDGDGQREMEARLRYPDGRTAPLAVSREREWVDLPMPAEAGQYVVELRQKAGAVQYSNTVGFSLRRAENPVPLTLTQVDETGLLEVTAELLLPTETRPTQVGAQVAGQPVEVDGQFRQQVLAGDYPVQPAPVTGAQVTVDKPVVQVPKGGTGQAKIQVKPEVRLALNLDKPQVCAGDVVTFDAQALTDYRGNLPLDLRLDAGGLKFTGAAEQSGEFSAAQPGQLRLEAVAEAAGTYTVTARLPMWNQTVSRTVEVLPQTTAVQLRRELPQDLEPGEQGTVRVLLTNTGTQPAPYTFKEVAGTGLTLTAPAEFSGTLAAGETKELTYQVQAEDAAEGGQAELTGTLTSGSCAVPQTSAASLNIKLAPPPQVTRTSEVVLPFSAPAQARSLIVAHQVPAGATFQPGSALLNGEPLENPKRGASGLLYWTVPATAAGQISYTLNHTGPLGTLAPASLVARYGADRQEVLEGRFDAKDYAAAQPVKAEGTAVTENQGSIKLPLDGTVYRTRDKITVTVEMPQGTRLPLTVNGQPIPEELLGTNTQDGVRHVQRLTYVGVPLKAGKNVLRMGDEEITVTLASRTQRVQVLPEQLVADGSSTLRVRLVTLDEFGTPTNQPTVTVRSNLEPQYPDTNTSEAGYQVRLTDGEGVLELRPQTVPGELVLDVEVAGEVQTSRFQVVPDQSRFGVGLLTATLGLDGDLNLADDLTWTARGYFEGPVQDGKLFVAADKDGLPNDRDPFERFPMSGDASTHSVPLQGIDPVAAVYDHPAFRATYQRTAVPVTVLPVGETLTALTAETKSNPKVTAFAAYVPADRVELRGNLALRPDGLRIIHLPNTEISRGSDSLELVVREAYTGKELSRTRLERFDDYSIDYAAGIITLNDAIQPYDEQFNDVVIEAVYRLDNALQNREWAYGAQAEYKSEFWRAGVAAVQMPASSVNNELTLGASAGYDNKENVKADARVAYATGFQATLDADAKLREQDRATLRVRYQSPEYAGLGKFEQGFSVRGQYAAQVSPLVQAQLEAEYRDDFKGAEQGYVKGTVDYRLKPFLVGGGLRYDFGDTQGLSGVARLGYLGTPVSATVEHQQPFFGDGDTVTTLDAGYKLTETSTLKLRDKYVWGEGHQAVVGVDSRLGNTNYSVGYELPNADGDGNRARFGVSTSLPLNERTTLGLRGDAVYSVAGKYLDASAGADVRFKGNRYVATAGADVGWNGAQQQFHTALRGGVSGQLSDELTLTADALAEFRGDDAGQRLTVGYAYRGATLNSLGYARYINGSLSGGNPALTTGLVAEYRQPQWAVRAGSDTRLLLNDKATFSGQAYLGGNYYLTDYFGVGAWGRAFYQPSSDVFMTGYGVEGSLRALPGTWVSAGYNFAGFEGLPTAYTYTKPGAYLRLDLTVDELTLGERK